MISQIIDHMKNKSQNSRYALGIKTNIGQFCQQLLQVFFVGLTIGLQRNVVPILAEIEFGVPAGAFIFFMAFIISFGFVKGLMNFVAGRLSDYVGRRNVLLWGWLLALPIPFIFLFAPSWHWIVAANILLGLNQGFTWSMTVTSKVDITRAEQRGLATGINEFFGYGGVAIAGVVIGYLANDYDPRWSLFSFSLIVILLALLVAFLFIKETLPWAQAEAAAHKDGTYEGPTPRFANLSEQPSATEVFKFVSFKHRTFSALSQAGLVEKFADCLVWAFFPIYFIKQGLTVIEIGWIVGIYGMVWGANQLWTGPLSDVIGRKWLIVSGMWLCSLGVIATLLVKGIFLWSVTAALMGIGMAMLYPTLIAAVGDISHPNWRGSSLGTYRFWRDTGYGVGALAIGFTAEIVGNIEAGFMLTAGAMFLSGLWASIMIEETLPNISSDKK